MTQFKYSSKEASDVYSNAGFSKLVSLKACKLENSLETSGTDYFIDSDKSNKYFTYTENSDIKYIPFQKLKHKIEDNYIELDSTIESQFWLKPRGLFIFKTGIEVSRVDSPIKIFNANNIVYSQGVTILGGIVLIYSDQEIKLTLINLSDKVVKIPVGQEIACLLDDSI